MRRLLTALLSLTLVLVACSADEDGTGTLPTTDGAGPQATADDGGGADGGTDAPDDGAGGDAAGGDAPVPPELDFVLDDVRGGTVEGADFAGRDVVVWFWAPWCTRCNQEAPEIAELAGERGDVGFLGMAGLDDVDAAADFVERHGLGGFPHAYDEDGDSWAAFGITTQSSFAFVNDDGSYETVSYQVLGSEEIQRRIDELVAA